MDVIWGDDRIMADETKIEKTEKIKRQITEEYWQSSNISELYPGKSGR